MTENSYEATLARAKYVKHVIEDCDGYRYFYVGDDPVRREEDLKILFRMTWYSTRHDYNSEVNNGRGPADAVISNGSSDKSLAEFKLASNSKLKKNLKNQTGVYEKASVVTNKTIKMIVYFNYSELKKVNQILKELKVENDDSIVLIDARKDNKVSASNI